MGGYTNGRFPLSMFIHRGDNIYLTPSLNARWNEAVRIALEKYGVRLYITGDVDGLGGWNGYRPYDAQARYKRHYGRFAAAAGWSSHGGIYGGKQVFAADVANWQMLAPGNDTLAWARFVAIMRTVGLTVDFVTPREQWHIGDFNDPWVAPVLSRPTINPETTRRVPEEEHIMDKVTLACLRLNGKNTEWALCGAGVPGGVRSTKSQATANAWARLYEPAIIVTDRHDWDTLWAEARALHSAWVRMQKSFHS